MEIQCEHIYTPYQNLKIMNEILINIFVIHYFFIIHLIYYLNNWIMRYVKIKSQNALNN